MGPGVSINSNQSDSFSPELPDENREETGEESCCVGTFVWIMCTLLPIRKKKNPHQDNFWWSFGASVIKIKKRKEFSEVERAGAERNPEPIHHLRENTLTPCILFPSLRLIFSCSLCLCQQCR